MKFFALMAFILLIVSVFWHLILGIKRNENLSAKEKLNHVPQKNQNMRSGGL